ncbi:hypothetical protein [Herbidospora sp. NBRC 101105]|uniref:hypothetical protein n=1 Tax=Herbidospora sp. NBRC 101105 TaxID=3032195 RepID=UPI0024A476A2|nr:hypothetical protein [Herbidospora sp. NBRC 101105]GLX93116.1 hypothetical protein Hesp01_10660 [Herbidospora sp. NBRC 101105]
MKGLAMTPASLDVVESVVINVTGMSLTDIERTHGRETEAMLQRMIDQELTETRFNSAL